VDNILSGLKVVLVGPIPPPAGGMANQTRKLRRFLIDEECDCQLVATNAAYRPNWAGKLPGIRALFRLIPYMLTLDKACKEADIMHVMANSGWSWHLFAAPAIVIARWNHIPVVINYRGGYAREFFEKSWFWVEKTLKKVQQVIVPSPFLQDVFADWQIKAGVVPNVLDDKLFVFKPKKEVPSNPHLMVARNLEQIYDVATAIRAFSIVKQQFPKATLSVAGSGPQLQMLKQLVEDLKLGDDVTFTGKLHIEQMAALYHNADMSINPSIVDNTPNSIIESLACGTPVVTTNVGGIPKLVTNNVDALLVAPQEPELMANAILQLLNNNNTRQQLVKNGLQTTMKFHWQNVKTILMRNYQAAIDDNRSQQNAG
jgi:glycosyltransferase involved in cell wall biosynthesis